MRKILLFLFLLMGIALVSNAQTQSDDNPGPIPPLQLSLGVDVGGALSPTSQTYSTAAGISAKLDIPFQNPKAFLTITAAYSSYSVKNTPSTDTLQNGNFIPLLIGFKYFVAKHLFLEGDIGDSYNINQHFFGYQNAFTYSPVVGWSIPLTKPHTAVDISAYYESRLSQDGNINQAAIRVAYKFGL
jgi:hypothetical protein